MEVGSPPKECQGVGGKLLGRHGTNYHCLYSMGSGGPSDYQRQDSEVLRGPQVIRTLSRILAR